VAHGKVLTGNIVAVALVTAGASAEGAVLPSPEMLSRKTVAVVSYVSVRLGTITKREFQRALIQEAAANGLDSVPRPGGAKYEELKRASMGSLLDQVWIKGQAAEMGITVTRDQVTRTLARLKKVFESAAEYREFLKEAHFTRRDVNERIEVQMLAERIRGRVERKAGGKSGRNEVVRDFVAALEQRWRARTVCALEYAIDRCSNGSTGSAASG